MKNSLALKIGGFTALVSTSLFGSVTAANAANVDGCGLEPDGGTLENNSGICELTFDSAGTFSWTLPAGIAGLYGVLVGAGGGALFESPDTGYAGAGGSVEYTDLTSGAADDTVAVIVGGGGDTGSSPTDGDDTSVALNSGTPDVASGGAAGGFGVWGYCVSSFRSSWYWGENIGAGTPGADPDGGACIGGEPGIIPDSDGSAPSAFDGFVSELGHGGGVYLNTAHAQGFGDGANVFHDSVGDSVSADEAGAEGAVIFRYTAADANNATDSGSGSGSGSGSRSGLTNSLAFTGNDVPVAAIALTSVAIIAAGIGAVAFGRRRSRASR
ncbi:unannotated protein [freshwater metagenome]|uniref:Unannotated protein n=1 Tax=freshwater metagenome TaxID=449393 RepID=A0A6J7DHU2_9ZZZZ|nr:hypothetical protein [Actinomycetota bacterium]MUH53586.1 hypothetical protein [Actinomycetota bacterium]